MHTHPAYTSQQNHRLPAVQTGYFLFKLKLRGWKNDTIQKHRNKTWIYTLGNNYVVPVSLPSNTTYYIGPTSTHIPVYDFNNIDNRAIRFKSKNNE